MNEADQSWEEIAKRLKKEADPRKRKELERVLGSALERAGFQKFSRGEQAGDQGAEDAKPRHKDIQSHD